MDRYPQGLIVAALGGIMLIADGVAFVLAVAHVGIGGELHPIATGLYAGVGARGVLAAKVAQAALAAPISLRLTRGGRAARVAAWAPATIGGLGALTGLIAII